MPIYVQSDSIRFLVVVPMIDIGKMRVAMSEPRMHMPMHVRFAVISRCVVLLLSGIPNAPWLWARRGPQCSRQHLVDFTAQF